MRGLVRPPCGVQVKVCVQCKGGGVLYHHACMNEHVIACRVIGAESVEGVSGPAACCHEWPQQGETVPHCQVIWQKPFFTPPHVKFINISPSFFSLLPLRMSSDQLSSPSCFLPRPKRPRQMCHTPRSRDYRKRSRMCDEAGILRALLVWSLCSYF